MSHDLSAALNYVNMSALDAAIRAALGSKSQGVSGSQGIGGSTMVGPDNPTVQGGNPNPHNAPVILHMDDTALAADDAAALALAAAHDPVLLSADKTVITADGVSAATVTVTALKQGTAAVTLSIVVNGAAPTDWPFTLTGGVGSDTITSLDPATIVISVKNPANRSSDTLTITAK